MAKYEHIKGVDEMIMNITRTRSKMIGKVADVVEMTAIDVANHAKEGHAGNMAHASKRYQNQTTNLTNNIKPEMVDVSFKQVVARVVSNMDYSQFVEFGLGNSGGLVSFEEGHSGPTTPYPFMQPALLGNRANFNSRLKKLNMKGF
ncbi:MAG: hypothetical protein KAS32_25995 [Candidatus Peribacteraceae bacterium]|nr:hypothetical protein [Candidatus Peribacteraceae bacterium]